MPCMLCMLGVTSNNRRNIIPNRMEKKFCDQICRRVDSNVVVKSGDGNGVSDFLIAIDKRPHNADCAGESGAEP